MPHRGENKRNSTLRCTKTGGIQPKLNVACFVQSCLTDADFVIFSNYCLIGTRPSRPFFSVRRCGAGRGRFTPLCGYTLSTPCGGTCLPAGRSVRGSDRPPACHSTPRTPQVEGWGKIWGVLPVCGQLFCFSGMGADDLDKGVRI